MLRTLTILLLLNKMKMLGKAHIDTAARLGMDLQWKLPSSPWVGRVCALPHGKGGPWWGPAVEVRWAYVSSAPSRTGVRQWMLSNKFYDLALLSRKISSFCEESDEQGESESIAVRVIGVQKLVQCDCWAKLLWKLTLGMSFVPRILITTLWNGYS